MHTSQNIHELSNIQPIDTQKINQTTSTENKSKIHQSFHLLTEFLKDAAMMAVGSSDKDLLKDAGVNLDYVEKKTHGTTNLNQQNETEPNNKKNPKSMSIADLTDLAKSAATITLNGAENIDPQLQKDAGVDTSYGN